MNVNNIRKVMGKENAGTISPSLPILDSIDRRRSVTHTDDSIKEMIMRAPFIETVEKIGGSEEGDGDRESFASALALWIRETIVPAVRKEALNESEKEAQQAVRVVQTAMESVQAVNKEILGRGSPEECEKVFDGRLKKLEIELEEMMVAKEEVAAIQVAVERVTSFKVGVDGKREYIGDASLRKEKQEMRKEQENITKNRAERHNLFLASTIGSDSVKGEFTPGGESLSEKVDFPRHVLSRNLEELANEMTRFFHSRRGSPYFVLYPFIQRILSSYSPTEGAFWAAPQLEDIARDFPWMVEEFIDQAEKLCNLMKSKWEKDWKRVTDTYTYGIDSQYSVSEAFIEGDALRVFHCLVTIISNEEGNAIDDIEVELLSAPKKFISAHPRAACDYLRELLNKAENLDATVPFRLVRQICENLVKRSQKYLLIQDRYREMPANTRRDKASRVLLKLLTEVKERADTIDTEEGNKVRFMEDAVKEEHTRAVGSSSKNDGGGRKHFPECRAENCSTKVCEARRSKERPFPPHPAGLCLEHFFSMIRDKSVKLKNGKYICSEKQLDGSWKYSASDTHIPRPKKKSAFFVQTKEEELLNQIIQESGSEEEGNIYEEDLQQVLEYVRSVGTKRKREEQNPVFAVEKFIDETSTADTGN